MTYEEWERGIPEELKTDVLWRLEAYRLALFLSDLAWEDATKLLRDRRTRETADQLHRATAKISAHVAEGYSRDTGKERAHFYGYALGSTRESRDWYYKSRHVLGGAVTAHRLALTTSLIRLILAAIRHERKARRLSDPRPGSIASRNTQHVTRNEPS
jgi:four helix bundle protein